MNVTRIWGCSLNIRDLEKRHPGLTKSMAGVMFESASVCLARHHVSPQSFDVRLGGTELVSVVDWDVPTRAVLRSYANEIDATEMGACGLCLASVEEQHRMVAIHRAETLTGADYYIVPLPVADPDDLENAVRLEVSGTDQSDFKGCNQRLNSKIAQTKKAGHDKPAIAGVVGFRERLVLISDKIEP